MRRIQIIMYIMGIFCSFTICRPQPQHTITTYSLFKIHIIASFLFVGASVFFSFFSFSRHNSMNSRIEIKHRVSVPWHHISLRAKNRDRERVKWNELMTSKFDIFVVAIAVLYFVVVEIENPVVNRPCWIRGGGGISAKFILRSSLYSRQMNLTAFFSRKKSTWSQCTPLNSCTHGHAISVYAIHTMIWWNTNKPTTVKPPTTN